MCLHLHEVLWPRIEADAGLTRVYRDIEIPTAEILARIERQGVLVDASKLQTQSHELGQRLLQLEQEAYAIAGQPFNLGSPKQIGEILFTKLGLPIVKKTATGAASTDEEVLSELALEFPLPAKILEVRALSKLKSTYTDKLPLQINPATGRIHTNYAQAVAVTGRLSSNEPNLQNIPIRTAEGRRVREAFIAPPGRVIASADYSQIELRILAHLSEDPGLIAAFQQGDDFHAAVSAQLGVDRRAAKAINFGIVYGLGAAALGNDLGITQAEAKAFIDRYFQTFPKVAAFIEAKKEEVRRQGFVETLFGRRRYLPDIASPNMGLRSAAERMAVNMPCQGTQADLIKMAMIRLGEVLDLEQSRMLLQIHDELLLEVRPKVLEPVGVELRKIMSEVTELRVPIEVGLKTGSNWADLAALT
jgi:DNA polymerase-1